MPWRNGAGTTTEVAAFPPGAGMDEFTWRLAIADLDRSGPFSSFPGIDRLLMVLPPGEVALTIDGTERALPSLEVLRFAGESVVSATLDRPARDLNLMVRRGEVTATMATVALDGERRLTADGALMVLCAIEGSVGIESGGARVVLSTLDCALIEPAGRRQVKLLPAGRALLAAILIKPVDSA